MDAFETGTYNLVVTTKYAEYLEFPRLSLIVQYVFVGSRHLLRLTMYNPISYNLFEKPPTRILVRADSDTALTVHLVERDNDLHKRYLKAYCDAGIDFTDTTQKTTTSHDVEDNNSDSEDEVEHAEYIQDPTTGRRIQQSNAIAALTRLSKSTNQSLSFRHRQRDSGEHVVERCHRGFLELRRYHARHSRRASTAIIAQ